MFSIEIANEQDALRFDERRLERAVEAVLRDAGILAGTLSIAVVDDAAIHLLNKKYLEHDYPTDVLSFVLERDGQMLEGEVIVSAQMAARAAASFGWRAEDELLLYVLHGTLHLVGYDDATDDLRAVMFAAQRHYLAGFGLECRESAAGEAGGRE